MQKHLNEVIYIINTYNKYSKIGVCNHFYIIYGKWILSLRVAKRKSPFSYAIYSFISVHTHTVSCRTYPSYGKTIYYNRILTASRALLYRFLEVNINKKRIPPWPINLPSVLPFVLFLFYPMWITWRIIETGSQYLYHCVLKI